MNAIAQTANVETINARRLAHKTDNFSIDLIEGKTQAAIMTEIKDANYVIGTKSLSALIKGEKTEAGDFMIVGGQEAVELAIADAPKLPTADEKAAAKKNADEAKAAAKAASAKKMTEDAEKAATDKKPENEEEVKADKTPDAPVINAESDKKADDTAPVVKVEGDAKEEVVAGGETTPPAADVKPAEPKAPRVLKDWGDELPPAGVYREVKKGTMIDRLFAMLMRPEGATKAQLLAEFNWSSGGMSGILGWEPKKKGYHLTSNRVDGAIVHRLEFHAQDKDNAGKLVKPEDIKYVQPKPAPEPKAPKAPKEPKAPKDPKSTETPVSTRRVSAKKQKELDEAAAKAAGENKEEAKTEDKLAGVEEAPV